jgi:hypothetical protein
VPCRLGVSVTRVIWNPLEMQPQLVDVGGTPSFEEVKIFVGQIPHTFNEQEMKEMFEPYGSISEVVVLRNKQTNEHKGAFSSFFSFFFKQANFFFLFFLFILFIFYRVICSYE